jgi:hypothetical protein
MNKTITVDVIALLDKMLSNNVFYGKHFVSQEMYDDGFVPKERLDDMVRYNLGRSLANEIMENKKLAKELIKKFKDRDRGQVIYFAEVAVIPVEDVKMLRKLIKVAFESNHVPV